MERFPWSGAPPFASEEIIERCQQKRAKSSFGAIRQGKMVPGNQLREEFLCQIL